MKVLTCYDTCMIEFSSGFIYHHLLRVLPKINKPLGIIRVDKSACIANKANINLKTTTLHGFQYCQHARCFFSVVSASCSPIGRFAYCLLFFCFSEFC